MKKKRIKKSKGRKEDRAFLIARYVTIGTARDLIRAKCIECIYDVGGEGTWRKQVSDCTDSDCPLYSKRPTSKRR